MFFLLVFHGKKKRNKKKTLNQTLKLKFKFPIFRLGKEDYFLFFQAKTLPKDYFLFFPGKLQYSFAPCPKNSFCFKAEGEFGMTGERETLRGSQTSEQIPLEKEKLCGLLLPSMLNPWIFTWNIYPIFLGGIAMLPNLRLHFFFPGIFLPSSLSVPKSHLTRQAVSSQIPGKSMFGIKFPHSKEKAASWIHTRVKFQLGKRLGTYSSIFLNSFILISWEIVHPSEYAPGKRRERIPGVSQ